ncbi:ABC transporter ATP-binding protein [Thermoleptolyngbya sp. C42_A2020_037]|uniref:ABC transporter ATP-binding protein n=1 Tax=Thermoleptolyngbya sp. C42_A2020_037 TaxID=2747799 RepID=UPI0019F0E72C|nr:ABC transporter ATP-binding protein [Thermoleptolyngbya sp. C42_A2020_037]MBF2086982.1 ABC transporter ATP-binding protein [Thermoleptolyngbya sp. C42_A2020_037]
MASSQSFHNILNYYRRYWGLSVFSITASSLFEVVDLAVPYAIGQLLNVLSGQPLDGPLQRFVAQVGAMGDWDVGRSLSLVVLLGIIFLVTVVRAPIQAWLGVWFHWDIALKSRRDHTIRAIAKVLSLPLEFYDENNPGRISGRVARGLANHTWTYPEIAGQLIPKIVRVIGIFGVILLIEWRIAILFLISFVLILAFLLHNLRRLIKKEERLDEYMENTESRTSEIITNIKTVKAFATEANELERQRQRIEREFKVVDYRVHKGYVTLFAWQKLVVESSVFVVLALTLWATVQGNISLGHFVTTLTVSSMAYAELEPICTVAEVFARRYASMNRFHEFMQTPDGQDSHNLLDPPAAVRHYQFTGKVHFENLSFGYERDRPVLQNINLLIEPRQTVALVGRSGSGKSTLVKLLFRYFEPHSGRVLIDGQDVRSLDITGYRKRLAIVHQEVDVFNGTLMDNLTYGNPRVTQEAIAEACHIARVDEFVKTLPQGYLTVVGERGVRLSGGQRQRLGIARALLMNPDVLVFDEATSSLDYESERSIQLAMQNILGTRTTIIIAHRLSTVREADQIVVLDQGQIVEVGSHMELLAHGGIYHRLHALQETGELMA